jgi:hypothetical protein
MPDLSTVLNSIYARIHQRRDLEESEVTDVFTDNDFFQTLGYEGIPIDVRSENHIVGGDRPDYFAKDDIGNVIFVVEFKKPTRDDDLGSHRRQLWEQYVVPLGADYGVLTDGEELIFYQRVGRDNYDRRFRVSLNEISDEQLAELEQLRKPSYSFNSTEDIEDYFATTETVSVGTRVDGEPVGQNEFMDTFRLERGTLFYQMLEQTYSLLEYYLDQPRDNNFPRDAYEFWKEYYASDPSWYDLPEEWRDIAGSAANKQKVMFAVETVQSLLGRLMLAKACEDQNFPGVNVSRFVQTETAEFRGEVSPVSYIHAGRGLMEQMREELVESVFEQDIYYWWTQGAEEIDELSDREIYEESWPTPLEEYGKQFVEFILAIGRFDFSDISGDPLGQLYQQYFDRRTRQALGEFYTPPSICEYVVDSVGYGDGVQYSRLVDPACGSGTFLISALDRYKDELSTEMDHPAALQDLCNRARVVGLDIHPFAVVMAQIRFMLEILDEYKRAIEDDPGLVLRRLPVFRTDSLIDESETEEGRQQSLGASFGEDTIEFDMPLPIRRGEEFETMTFEFPRFSEVQSSTAGQINNRQEYFSALLAVFDAVKDQAKETDYDISEDSLVTYLYSYFSSDTNVEQVASTFVDTAETFLDKVQELREDYNDGRLLKLIEDLVLSAVLKNEVDFDYVVGNPPWVAKQNTHSPPGQERRLKQQYYSAWKETDPYLQFTERGFEMLREGGTLGLVVSNRFLTNQGGKEVRALLAKNRVVEIVDFTDYPVFSGATNYSAILTAEKQVPNDDWESFIEDGQFTNRHTIKTARVRDWEREIPALVDQLYARDPTESVDFYEIGSERFQRRVPLRNGAVLTEEVNETFEDYQNITVTRNLPMADIWPNSPREEYEIVEQIESEMEMRLGDRPVVRDNEVENAPNLVGDNIRVGIQTSGDDAYIVHPEVGIDKENLHNLDRITVSPRGIDGSYTVETDLLKIDITGEDAARWLPEWSNRLVFVPYIQGDERARLVPPNQLANEHPQTWEYFTDTSVLKTLSNESIERNELHARLAAEFDIIDERNTARGYRQVDLSDSDYRDLSDALRSQPDEVYQLNEELWWYRYMYRKNIEILPEPKVLTGDLVQYNKLSFDDDGIMAPHNVSVYAIILPRDDRHSVAAVLNSTLTEYFHKQHSRIHQGKAYRYIEDHTSQWPLIRPSGEERDQLESLVEEILHLKDLEIKIPQFPDPYIAEAREGSREFVDISYTPSSTYEAAPSVQPDLSGDSIIELSDGRIDDSIVASDTVAEYVRQALNGRELEANTQVSVPVPLDTNVAEDALDELEADCEELESTNIDDIEAEIDRIVFNLYGVNCERHREIMRRYNNQYRTVQRIDPGTGE